MRLIDAERVGSKIEHSDLTDYEKFRLLSAALSCETVDATPTVHARWKGPEEPPYIKGVVCTNCEQVTFVAENYCPNCGAKMDLNTKEDR